MTKKRKCNVCGHKKPDWMFKHSKKKTCQQCEFRWYQRILRLLVQNRKLTRWERMGMRIGYMGVGFLIAGQWTIEPLLFILGFICVLIQVSIRRQWNLVILQLNGLIAWTLHFLESIGYR